MNATWNRTRITKIAATTFATAVLFTATAAFADTDNSSKDKGDARKVGSTIEVHINDNGNTIVRGAKVTSIASSSIQTMVTMGSLNMNWNVVTDGSTNIIRRFGGDSNLAEIQVGDFISFSGMLDQTQATPTVKAKVVKDWSIQKAHAEFSGVVKSVTASTTAFVLTTKNRGDINVTTSASTTITRNGAAFPLSSIVTGTEITLASGLYDNNTNTLSAEKITVKADKLLEKHTFEGTVTSAPAASSTPTSFGYMVGSSAYTVNVPTGISILNNKWLATSITTIKVGDKVRVYGSVQASSTSMIDASIVRDTSVK